MDPLLLSWLAGFTAGEGYLGLDSSIRVVWTNTHRPTLEWIQGMVGGTLRVLSAVQGGRKPRYQLTLHGQRARDLLKAMSPLLAEKRAQADLILSYVPGRRGLKRSQAVLDQLTHIRAQLKALRHAPS